MQTATASRASRCACAHCGLPVASAVVVTPSGPATTYCCHACRLAAVIVGNREGSDHAAHLLRLGLGALLAMNVMMISLLLYTNSVDARSIHVFRLVLLALSAPALAVLIPPFLAGAGSELAARKMSLDCLIAGGSLSAFAVSAVNALSGTGDIYFDTATMLPVLVTVGKLIEASAKTRAADLLHSLEALLPKTALQVSDGIVEAVAIDDLKVGDSVRVRPGERIPVDGKILEGTSTIDEAAFSGEFLPRLCHPGDRVIAGTVNGSGSLLVVAERTGRALLLHGIIDMIQDAWGAPSRAERIAERVAALFIPTVLAVAALAGLYWSLTGHPGQALLSALSVLVVACPCTMGIATPLATSLAVARAARAGCVVRGGQVMERMAATQTIFFDKTGTITTGTPELREIVLLDPLLAEDELLARVAALESASEHALGKAIIAKAVERGIERGCASEVAVYPGFGLQGKVEWRGVVKEVSAGAGMFAGIEPAAEPSEEGLSVIEVAWDGVHKARLLLGDSVRSDARRCVEELETLGIRSVLLSGDRFSAAAAAANEASIDEVCAPRTPGEKRDAVAAASSGRTVAMVGDGINDAPALAAAHVGFALGSGMELAKQAGNVVILSGSLEQIPWLIKLSRRTGRIIRGNFAWSFAYNGVALAAAAAGLLHPLLAALAMVASSVTVLGNSLRITGFPDSGEPHPHQSRAPHSHPDPLLDGERAPSGTNQQITPSPWENAG